MIFRIFAVLAVLFASVIGTSGTVFAQAARSPACTAILFDRITILRLVTVVGVPTTLGPFAGGFAEGETILIRNAPGNVGGVITGFPIDVTFQQAGGGTRTFNNLGGDEIAQIQIGAGGFNTTGTLSIIVTPRVSADHATEIECNPGVLGAGGGGAGDADADEAAATEQTIQNAEAAVRLPTTTPGLGSTFTPRVFINIDDPELIRQQQEEAVQELTEEVDRQFDRFSDLAYGTPAERALADFLRIFVRSGQGGEISEFADVTVRGVTGDFSSIVGIAGSGENAIELEIPVDRFRLPNGEPLSPELLEQLFETLQTHFTTRFNIRLTEGRINSGSLTVAEANKGSGFQDTGSEATRLSDLSERTSDNLSNFGFDNQRLGGRNLAVVLDDAIDSAELGADRVLDETFRGLDSLIQAQDNLRDGDFRGAHGHLLEVVTSGTGVFGAEFTPEFRRGVADIGSDGFPGDPPPASTEVDLDGDIILNEGEAILFTSSPFSVHNSGAISFEVDSEMLGQMAAVASAGPNGVGASTPARDTKVWLKGRLSLLDGDVDGETAEVLVGAVTRLNDQIEVGAFTGFFGADLTAGASNTDSETTALKLGLYANALLNNGMRLGLSGSAEFGETDTNQAGTVADFGYQSYDLSASASATYVIKKVSISPSFAGTVAHRNTDAHTNSGGVAIAGRTQTDLIATGAIGVSRTYPIDGAWVRTLTPNFATTGNFFLTDGNQQDFDRLAATVGGGLVFGFQNGGSLSATTSVGGFGQGTNNYSGQLRLILPF